MNNDCRTGLTSSRCAFSENCNSNFQIVVNEDDILERVETYTVAEEQVERLSTIITPDLTVSDLCSLISIYFLQYCRHF